MLIHIAGSKSGFWNDFEQYGAKTIILCPFLAFFDQAPLRNSIAIATPKIQVIKTIRKGVLYVKAKSHKVSVS